MPSVVVRRVLNGSTFVDREGDLHRLADVDAPDPGEPGYEQAKQKLARLIEGEVVSVTMRDWKQDTWICYITLNAKNINRTMRAALRQQRRAAMGEQHDPSRGLNGPHGCAAMSLAHPAG